VPRLPSGALARPRIDARFEGAAALVVAVAPAGYGKTVAMAQWATRTAADGVWMRVRDADTGPAAVVQGIADELAIGGLLAESNPLALASDALAGGADPWHLLRSGLRALDGDIVVAIDGIDRLSGDARLGIIRLVAEVPAVSVRATARRSDGLAEPALSILLDTDVIRTTELALTDDEAAAILGEHSESPRVVELIAAGGAPLVARAMATASDGVDGAAVGASLPGIGDSLLRLRIASEAWDDAFVDFLAVTSLADTVTPALASLLLGIAADGPTVTTRPPDAGVDAAVRMLDRAESEGLGLWTEAPDGAAAFIYTPLMREAFERMLRGARPTAVRDLDLAVARWEAQNGAPYGALRRAVGCGDWALASQVVRSHWNEIMRNHGTQLHALFHGTPLSVLRRQPLVTMLLALQYNRTGRHRLRALEYFALAGHGARSQRSTASAADRAILRSIEAAGLRVSGRFDRALVAALDGRDILLGMGPADRDALGRTEPTLHNQIGTTLFYAGRTEEALDAFARSTAVGEARGLKAGLQGLALSAGALAIAGDLPDSRALVAEADALLWPDGWITGYMGSFYQVAAAFSALESFDAVSAEAHLRTLDPHRETIEHWPVLAHLEALVGILSGEPQRARLRLENEIVQQRRRHAVAPQSLARLAHTRSLIELADGKPAAAARALGRGGADSRRYVALARIALAHGQPEDALRHLLAAGDSSHGASSGGEPGSARSRGEALALRAGALALLGDEGRAALVTDEAMHFLADRQQGLALALVPQNALDAMIALAAGRGESDHEAALELARHHAVIPSARPAPSLTSRELALARALPQVRTVTELSALLSVSPNTVKSQLQGLYRKLGVANRADAIAALSVVGLIDARPAEAPRPTPQPFD
jgi:LuxR family maltose regulon positive regulatory protein